MIRPIRDTLAALAAAALLGCSGPSEIDLASWEDGELERATVEREAEPALELVLVNEGRLAVFHPLSHEAYMTGIDKITNRIGRMSEDLLAHQAVLSLEASFPQEAVPVELAVPGSIIRGIVIMGAAMAFVGAGILIMLAVLLSRVRKIPTWQVQQVNGPTS